MANRAMNIDSIVARFPADTSVHLLATFRWPDAVHSALYGGRFLELEGLEAMGGGGSFRRLAGIAVPIGRTAAAVAIGFCVVRIGSAALRDSVEGVHCASSPVAPRLFARVSLRISLVHGKLLLGSRHDGPVRRYAGDLSCSAIDWV